MSDLGSPCEKELLLKISRGDEHAFSELFNTWHHLLGRHIYKITDSAELTEEVVQDVFLKIWTSRESLASVENFKAYLFVVSRNHALNCLRKLARERMHQKALEENATVLAVEQTSSMDIYHLLDQAIDHLPPQQQKVYLLSRHNRLKYDEIATHMGLSRETVKKYLQGATHSITNFVQSNINVSAIVLLAFNFILKR